MKLARLQMFDPGKLFLRLRLFAILVIITFLIIFAITLLFHYGDQQKLIDSAVASNRTAVNLLSTIVREHQKAVSGIVQSYASRRMLIAAVQKQDANAALKELKNLKDNNPEIDVTLIADRGGTLWINYPIYPETHGKNFANRDWYRGISKEWKPYISSVFKRVIAEQDLAIATVAPILDEKEKVIGILLASQRTVFLGKIIEEAISDPLTSVTLIDRAGSIIYSNRLPVNDEIVKYSNTAVLTRASGGETGDREIANPAGSDMTYLSFAPVRGTGWSVIAGKEKSAIVKAGYDDFIQRITIAILSFLFISLLFFFFRKVYLYQDKLNEAHTLYYDLYENAPDMHFSINATTGVIRECNKMFLLKTGFTKEEVIGRPIFELYDELSREDAQKRFQRFGQTAEINDVERKVIRKDGSIMDVSLSVTAVKDKDGNIIYSRSTWRDITERKKYEEMISALSITDQLTGLYNRRGFITLAEQQLKVAERTKNGLILFFADLDDLKGINDKSGHKAGDEALFETANVLREVLRKMDIIARVGGDEFAVLAPDASLEYADLIRNRLQDQLEVHNARKNRDFTLSLSMGVVYHDPANPASLDKLMARADSLMYKEKEVKK